MDELPAFAHVWLLVWMRQAKYRSGLVQRERAIL
jgi:tRNA (Thr-GGU) A37 N-methylase